MDPIVETPAVGAVAGSEMHIAAGSGDVSQDALAPHHRQDPDDPLRILRLHWGLCPLDWGGGMSVTSGSGLNDKVLLTILWQRTSNTPRTSAASSARLASSTCVASPRSLGRKDPSTGRSSTIPSKTLGGHDE